MWGDLRVAELEPSDVLALRDKRAETPAAANYLIRVLSLVISWGIPRGYRADNPCEHVRKLKIGEGYEPWPWEMIELVRAARADLDVARRCARALHRPAPGRRVADEAFRRARRCCVGHSREDMASRSWIPIHRTLATVLADIPRRLDLHRDQLARHALDTRRLPNVTGAALVERLHVADTARLSRSEKERLSSCCSKPDAPRQKLQAITGQSFEMVEHYAKQVNQKKLAASAILKWENAERTEFVQRGP